MAGMFGGSGKFGFGEALVAALNGYLASQGNPVGHANMRMMLEAAQGKRQAEMQEQQYQRQRQDGLQDYEAKQQIEQRYAQPGEFERALIASGVQPGTPQWVDAMKRRADNMLDPIVTAPNGSMMLRSQALGYLQGQPQNLPQTLSDDDWNQGGPTQPASGGFPGYYPR